MNLIFIQYFQHAGLALSIGLGACLNSAILFYYLHKRGIFQPEPGWLKFTAKIFIALLALGLVLWFGMMGEQRWLVTQGWARIVHLSWLVILGAMVYFVVLGVLGFRLKDFSKRGAS